MRIPFHFHNTLTTSRGGGVNSQHLQHRNLSRNELNLQMMMHYFLLSAYFRSFILSSIDHTMTDVTDRPGRQRAQGQYKTNKNCASFGRKKKSEKTATTRVFTVLRPALHRSHTRSVEALLPVLVGRVIYPAPHTHHDQPPASFQPRTIASKTHLPGKTLALPHLGQHIHIRVLRCSALQCTAPRSATCVQVNNTIFSLNCDQ